MNLKIKFLFLSSPFQALIHALTQQEIDHHLDMGKRMLAAGQLADSLTHYHAAVGKSI